MASCGGKSVIKALRRVYAYCLVIPLLVGIFMFYVFPGTIFCSLACPNAFFWIIVFSYLCFNIACSPAFLRAASEYICVLPNLLWWWYLWRCVKFNAMPLDLRVIILSVDRCLCRIFALWECVPWRFCSLSSPMLNHRDRQGPEGWYIWSSAYRLCVARPQSLVTSLSPLRPFGPSPFHM